MLIYTEHQSPRTEYIFRFVLEDILGISFRFVNSGEEAGMYDGPVINYSGRNIPGAFRILPGGLLAGKGHRQFIPPVSTGEGFFRLYPSAGEADLDFDPFSASFYLVSRYEEYGDPPRDRHGRFDPLHSLAFRHGFLEKPVVDEWAHALLEALRRRYPRLREGDRKFSVVSTIDLDSAYAYRGRPWWHQTAVLARDLFLNRRDLAGERFGVVFGDERDPFDVYDYLRQVHERYSLRPIFFIPVGRRTAFDRNLSSRSPAMKALIGGLSDWADMGIHPSYRTTEDRRRLRREIRAFSRLTGSLPQRSRQHFLRMDLPATSRMLSAHGIREEYSMGYPQLPGFRAGTCTPFRFYDLCDERESSLRIIPLAIMDGALNEYMGLHPAAAVERCIPVIRAVKAVNGCLHILWHNHSLSERGAWEGWRKVYEMLFRQALEK